MTINPQTGDISKLTNIEAIKGAVRNLILTDNYERPFHPEIGTPIRQLLFENASPIMGAMIEKIVSQVLQQYEPRAILQGVTVTVAPDSNSVTITIMFQPTTVNKIVTFDIVVERLR
jgi:phage baseplate assembly protein W